MTRPAKLAQRSATRQELEGAVASLVGRVPTDPNTQAPFLLPEPEQPKDGTNTEAMLASGVAVPQKPAGGSVTNELNDDIPFLTKRST